MAKERRGIFSADRGTQPGTAHSETPPGKGTGSGEGTPRASRHSRSGPPPLFALTSRGPSGLLWKDVQGSALAEGER